MTHTIFRTIHVKFHIIFVVNNYPNFDLKSR